MVHFDFTELPAIAKQMKENLVENQRDIWCFMASVPLFVSPPQNKHHQGWSEMLEKIEKPVLLSLTRKIVPSSA